MGGLREIHSIGLCYEFFTAEHFIKRVFFPKQQINFSEDGIMDASCFVME